MAFRLLVRAAAVTIFGLPSRPAQIRAVPDRWTPIFSGVRYVAEEIWPGPEGTGLVHVLQVDLSAPGIELFVTPLDPEALRRGWEYRLTYLPRVVQDQHLAVAVDADLFTSNRWSTSSFLEITTFSYMTEAVSMNFGVTGKSPPRPMSQFVFLTFAVQLYDELEGGESGRGGSGRSLRRAGSLSSVRDTGCTRSAGWLCPRRRVEDHGC